MAYFYLFINFVAGVCVCVCVFISISVKSLVGSAQILMMMMEEISQTTLIAPSKWWDKPTTYAQVKHAVLLHHPSFVWEVNALSIQKLFCVQPNHFFMHLLWSPKGLTLGEFANKKLVSNNQSLKKKVKLHPTPGRSGSQYSSLIPKLQRFRKVSWFSFRFAWMGAGTLRENPPNSSIRRFGLSNFPSKNSLNIKLSKPENSGFCDGSLTVKRVKIIQVGRWHTLELHFVLVGHLLFFGLAVPR